MSNPLPTEELLAIGVTASGPHVSAQRRPAFKALAISLALLALCFSRPLFDLARYALTSDLYSHVFLVPAISLYLIWIRRAILPVIPERSFVLAAVPFLLGLAGMLGYGWGRTGGFQLSHDDYLAVTIFSFLCFAVALALLTLGRNFLQAVLFPVAFLLFMVPFPSFVLQGIEAFFQHTSADAAHVLFSLSQTPFFRDGVVFHLPGTVIRVAEECSGIRSSLVLFVTSLIAGQMFLKTPWKRALLALAVIPLGIIRNALRILTISLLCIHVDPSMIDSPIHHRGGPLFFAISLVPFFALLLFLWRSERRKLGAPGHQPSTQGAIN